MYPHKIKITGTKQSLPMAIEVAKILENKLPKKMIPDNGLLMVPKVSEFANENMEIQLPESIGGCVVVMIHSMHEDFNRSQNEHYTLLDAIDNSKPVKIIVVYTSMPHARSDNKDKPHLSVMARRFARIINFGYGIRDVLLLDPHSEQIPCYFNPIADRITAGYLFIDHIMKHDFPLIPEDQRALVHADAGNVDRTEELARVLGIPRVTIFKRHPDETGKIVIESIAGDPKGKHCFMIEDEVLSGGTGNQDADLLFEKGALSVRLYATHPVCRKRDDDGRFWSDEEYMKTLVDSKISQFVFTDSIPIVHRLPKGTGKFTVLPCAGLVAEGLKRMLLEDGSPSCLYSQDMVKHYHLPPIIP